MKLTFTTILLLLAFVCNSQKVIIESEWQNIYYEPIIIIAATFTINEIIIQTAPYEDIKKHTWKVAVIGIATAGIVTGIKYYRDKKKFKKKHMIKYGGLYKKTPNSI